MLFKVNYCPRCGRNFKLCDKNSNRSTYSK